MYYIDHYHIGDIPLVEVAPFEEKTKPLPVVIFIHGFQSTKEINLHYAYFLAEKGFRVIMQDCLYHGERAKGFSEHELALNFWNIVIQSIDELSNIRDFLQKNNKMQGDIVGVAGTSMGGIITLGALTQYDWIHTAVSLMGNPAYLEFARLQVDQILKMGIPLPVSQENINYLLNDLKKYDLSIQPERLNNRPVMFWHGEKDTTVPFEHAYSFFEQVQPNYAQPELMEFHRDSKAGHKVSRFGVLQTASWFEKHLLPNFTAKTS